MVMDRRERAQVARALRAAASILLADAHIEPEKWVTMDLEHLKKNPDLVDKLFDLMQTAYKPIGGHLNIKNPQDLVNGEITLFHLKDEDGDGIPDAFLFSKEEKEGEKFVGLGHDGSDKAKKDVIKHQAEELTKPGHYAEVSEAMAHIFLTKFPDVPIVKNPKHIEAALRKLNPEEYREKFGKCPDGYNYQEDKKKCEPTGDTKPEKPKTIKFLGAHPEGKYPGKDGWYERTIGGKNVTKILVGMPEHKE